MSRRSKIYSAAMRILWGDRAIRIISERIMLVPSESDGARWYTVNRKRRTCECPHWRQSHADCKHLIAADLHWEKAIDDSPPEPVRRNPYKNPPCYDAVKKREKRAFEQLTRCLGTTIQEPAPKRTSSRGGRPSMTGGDLLVCALLANYDNKPSRKAVPDPGRLVTENLIQARPPSPGTLSAAMRSEAYNRWVRLAIATTTECVRDLEAEYSVDCTYIKTPNCAIAEKIIVGQKRQIVKSVLRKLFTIVGNKSLMILAATVTGEYTNDQTQFFPLLKQLTGELPIDADPEDPKPSSRRGRRIEIMCGDGGFNKQKHYEAVRALGGRAFFAFDSNAVHSGGEFPHYDEQFELHENDETEWHRFYDPRWLVECVYHAIKTGLRRFVRARQELAVENEILTLVLVYNLCRLIMLRAQYGIAIQFADERAMVIIDGLDQPKRVPYVPTLPKKQSNWMRVGWLPLPVREHLRDIESGV